MGRLAVAVIQGGPSTEAEVSRASAAAVARALEEAGHAVVRLELNQWVAESIRTGGYDVVFPMAHGAVGEDGSLQGLLEVLDMAYVGSGVLASAIAMDKPVARSLFERSHLPVARALVARRGQSAREVATRAKEEVSPRLVVKPASQGSAIGVARFDETSPLEEIERAITEVWTIDDGVLIEHFARGREITCGVLDRTALGEARALALTEILTPKDAFYTYEARYAPGRSVHTCPALLDERVRARVGEMAVAAHRTLGCRDLSRVDFIVGDDDDPDAITLLEVNTVPGMTPTSLYPEAARAAGIGFVALCDAWVRAAHTRGATPRQAAKAYPGARPL